MDKVDLTLSGMRKEVLVSETTISLARIEVLTLIQIAQELNEIKHILAAERE